MTDFNKDNPHQQVRLALHNGWHMSVVQGYGTYSTHGATVELAVRNAEGKFVRLNRNWRDDVCGWVPAAKLAFYLNKALKLSKGSD